MRVAVNKISWMPPKSLKTTEIFFSSLIPNLEDREPKILIFD